jgi:cell division topological specificity factor
MSFLQRLTGSRGRSANAARERLRLVLVHDRAELPPGKLEALKDDIIAAISRHVEIDTRGVSVSLTRDRHDQRLVADIPLAPPRARR